MEERTYTEEELVSFGNFMINRVVVDKDPDVIRDGVWHADRMNWEDENDIETT